MRLHNLLCRLGKHKWINIRFVYGQWTECYWCGKRKKHS